MTPAPAHKSSIPTKLPPPNSDFYELKELLPAEGLAIVRKVRVLPAINDLNLGGLGIEGYGCAGGNQLLFGLVGMEMARVDASIATFFWCPQRACAGLAGVDVGSPVEID